jgi:hypothetical protein
MKTERGKQTVSITTCFRNQNETATGSGGGGDEERGLTATTTA